MTTSATSVTNSTSPSAVSTSSIDVASIVSQLMTVANQPLVALQNKINTDNSQISDLGTLSSKIASLQTSLTTLESPNSYNSVVASSNNPSAVSVSAANGTPIGRYDLAVSQTAEATNISIGGFASPSDGVSTSPPFTLTVGTTTYSTNQSYSNGLIPVLGPSATVNDLSNWINSLSTNLGVNVSSNLVESGTNSYALVINGTQTGVANAVSFSGLDGANVTSVNGTTSTSSNVSYSNTSSVTNVSLSSNPIVLSSPSSSNNFTISLPNITSGVANILDGSGDVVNTLNLGSLNAGSNTINWDGKDSHGNDVSSGNYSLIVTSITNAHPVSVNTNASDAVLSINGLQVQRPTNTINDVVKGLTINLLSTGASNSEITVGQGADNTSTYVQNFVSAFNDVVAQHTSMVANPINSTSTTPSGSFSNDPGMLSFVDQIQNLIAGGALTSSGNQISLASLGMDLQSDGTLTFNSSELAVSQSNGLNYNGQQMSLQSILSNGISIGGSAGLSTNLDTTLASITDPGGTIYGDVQIQQSDINYTNTKISFLQNQLNELQNSYTQQYSTLNTLLYNLSQTSSQLTSSLAAVTNINSGK